MKASLIIEVPDDFKNGDYKNCPLSRGLFEKWCTVRSSFPFLLKCTAEDCHLEIQENNNDN